MAIKNIQGMDDILKEYFIEPIIEELRRDFNRQAFGGKVKRYELPYNKCHEHGLEHNYGKGQVFRGGVCWQCDGEGLASGEDTDLWENCPACDGRGYEPTRYYRQCKRCGFGDIRPRYGFVK